VDALKVLAVLRGAFKRSSRSVPVPCWIDMSPAGWCHWRCFCSRRRQPLPALGSGIAVSWLYALCLGGAYGSQQAIGAAGYAQYFGRDHLGAIRGTSFVFGIGGAAFGPLPFAASVDWTGTYFVGLGL